MLLNSPAQSRASLLSALSKGLFKHRFTPCCPSCRSGHRVVPAEALRCGAEGSGRPLAPPGEHDEQRLFAGNWGKHPDSHSKTVESTVCTDGSKSLNSRCSSATPHQEAFRRIFGDSVLKKHSLRAWNSTSHVPGTDRQLLAQGTHPAALARSRAAAGSARAVSDGPR